VKNNGAGELPDVWYHSGSHTNSLVPFYARGASSEFFEKCVVGKDSNLKKIYNLDASWSGKYIDNTCVYDVMAQAALDEKHRR
jgi:alkaline phosphatase